MAGKFGGKCLQGVSEGTLQNLVHLQRIYPSLPRESPTICLQRNRWDPKRISLQYQT